MGYPPNTKQWKRGDIVIHAGDYKGDGRMLMRVIGRVKNTDPADPLVRTRYLNPNQYSNMRGTCWCRLSWLLDPADFNITTPNEEVAA